MKRERKGPTLRGVTHQVVEVPVSLHEKGGGIVTSYFVNTGFKKKKAVLETFLRRESHHTQSFKGKCFLFFLSGASSVVAYFSIQPENSRILSAGRFDCLGWQLSVPRRGVLFISYYIKHTK